MQKVKNIGKTALLPWNLILLVSIIAVSHNAFSAYAGSTVYDFISHAPDASWSSGSGILPFPGNPADDRGFALFVDNALLEDGTMWKKVLETHPQWVSGGWIMGAYPQQTVASNVQLTVRIGFLSGATGTDGARFDVYFDEYRGINVAPLRYTILSQFATLDGRLDLITKDLGYLAGKKGTFILYVNAGQTSGRDWAVWAEARVETKALPDLVITDIWEKDGLIHYRVKNAGDAPTAAKRFCDALTVDGQQVALDYVEIVLQPGQEVEGTFNYTWRPAPGKHSVRVCADVKQDVDESNEQNNCLEEEWVKENLSDLIITEVRCDRNNSLIGYVVKNVGGEIAKGGHSTTLYVDGKEIAHDLVGVDLDPGETYESWFKDYEWPECHNITVKVCADNYDQVKESDEDNNCLERVCISYPIPILITYGPSAVNVTQDEATISWMTNKRSDSVVKYADRTTGEEKTVYDPSPVRNHQILLEGLEPRTTYRFYVASKDQCGNAVISKGRVFETESPPDEESPSVTLYLPESLSGVVNITADATDNVGVTEVIFLVDAHVKFIDFSPPYLWIFDTTLFPNGAHSFRAVAFDAALNSGFDAKNGTINNLARDVRPPAVSILRPHEGESVIGMIEIEAIIQDMALAGERIGRIQKAEIYVDDVLLKRWVYSPFHFDPFRRELVTEAPTNSLTLTHLWNTSGLVLGSEHEIEVKGWDDSGNYGHDRTNVSIARIEAYQPPLELRIINLEVTRDVERHGNWFDVRLTITNTGNQPLDHFMIIDRCSSFQPIALPMPSTSRDTEVRYLHAVGPYIDVIITPLMETLNPGDSWSFNYYAVPILYQPYAYWHAIGEWTDITFQCKGNAYRRILELPYYAEVDDVDENGNNDLYDVLSVVDYLIITNPDRLLDQNPTDRHSVSLLLQEMAVLAKAKNGILGYLGREMTADEIKSLISPRGEWGSILPAFRNPNPDEDRDAYVLIVGETEIVPSFNVTVDTTYIPLSDNPYADTFGGDGKPDIMVGRIIGNTARELFIPINTSLNVVIGYKEFDRSDALVVTGPAGPWEEVWIRNGDVLADLLRTFQGADVSIRHCEYYDTEVNLLREALVILGLYWDFDPTTYKSEPPPELDHLGNLVGVYDCLEVPGHTVGDPPSPCTKNHPPMDLATLRRLITKEDAELVEAVRIGLRLDGGALILIPYDIRADGCGALSERGRRIKEAARGKDIITYAGHGGPGSWACCLDAFIGFCGETELYTDLSSHPLDFGTSAPVVSAAACSTGYYEITDIGDISISEAFLRRGAAIYMGATISVSDESDEFHNRLFGGEWTSGCTIGKAFVLLKRYLICENIGWRVYAYHYNLYGDPKFGA